MKRSGNLPFVAIAVLVAGCAASGPSAPVPEGQGAGSELLLTESAVAFAELLTTLEEVQREHIQRVLRAQRGNIKATAQILGISRTTLYKKIRDYGIDAPL